MEWAAMKLVIDFQKDKTVEEITGDLSGDWTTHTGKKKREGGSCHCQGRDRESAG